MLARVSELETYRRWRESEDAELSDILPRLRGQEPASERMEAGTAFHKALEESRPGEYETLAANGYTFVIDTDAEIELPDIREVRSSKTYSVDGGAITVSGQVDAIEGRRVDDHKTTGQMDAEGYFAGYQWRFYLEIFGADTFRWNVFEVREASDRAVTALGLESITGPLYIVHDAHRLQQHRYPGMADDCERLAADFYRFAKDHLPERFALREAA